MSNTEVATYNGMTPEQLMEAMGVQVQGQQQTGNRMPLLKVNYSEEDDDGNELKKGYFQLQTENGPVYAKDAKIRVFADYMQYLDYDPEQNAVVNKTIIHRVGDEPVDELGSIRCGKPTSRELRELPEEDRLKYKDVTCFRYLYSTVSMNGHTATGEDVEIVNEPCLFRVKGASFLSFSEQVIEPCRAQKVQFNQVISTLTTKRQKKGSVTYFVIEFDPDFSSVAEISTDDLHFMTKILDTVNAENKQIMQKHNDALYGKQRDLHDAKVVEEVEDILEADFDETA
jgi:hypothetical protein